jgi:YVTN family beta-propeller protein
VVVQSPEAGDFDDEQQVRAPVIAVTIRSILVLIPPGHAAIGPYALGSRVDVSERWHCQRLAFTRAMTPRKPTRQQLRFRRVVAAAAVIASVASVFTLFRGGSHAADAADRPSAARSARSPDSTDVYAHTKVLRSDVATDLSRVYVPSGLSNVVTIIDPSTRKVVGSIRSEGTPQHIVPSYDLRTLWILNNKGDTVVPIDAHTGRVGNPIPVADPYNMYFTPDGSAAVVVAEFHSRLDFRDPHTMALRQSLSIPRCRGMNHADYSADGSYMLLTCEYSGSLVKINLRTRRVVGFMRLTAPPGPSHMMMPMPDKSFSASMPQDIRLSPDGRRFYVADMLQGGVYIVDGATLTERGFVPTGIGAHSITPSRDGKDLFIANRGSVQIKGGPDGPGSVSVFDTTTNKVTATWPIPGGGSPDMGNLSADGKQLWLSGRFDSEVYDFDTTTGRLLARIPVPRGPHGLTVWPQPGRFSFGHTGNMR